MKSPRIRLAAIVATLNYECFSLLFFPVDVPTTVHMLGTVWRAFV